MGIHSRVEKCVEAQPWVLQPGDAFAPVLTKRPTILMVDDDQDHLLVYGFLVESWGYNLITASSAEDALRILNTITVDLLLTDVMMPGLNGQRFVQKLRRSAHLRELPVIMLTAACEEAEKWILRNDGPDMLCLKKAATEELREQIEFLLN